LRKTKENTEISKLRILLAAEDEFCQRGFAAANIDNIAKTAGLTKGAIFWHYKNKVNLFRAVAKRAIERLKEMNRETFSPSSSLFVMERCREILKRLTKEKTFDILLIMASADETGEIPKEVLSEFYDESYRIFHDSIKSLAEAKKNGELHENTNPTAILLSIYVVLTGLAKIKQLSALSLPINQHIDNEIIIDMVFNGILSVQKSSG
jgi:AcrR family transcriptional regulator